jgi:ACS family glucarate transporter-like MFS transporter
MTKPKVYQMIGTMLFINTLIIYFDRVNLAIVAPVMMKEFGWDTSTLGLALSMFGIGYVFTQIPSGWLADKIGGRWILFGGSAVWTICTAITPFCKTPTALYTVRVLLGLGEGADLPAETSINGRWLPLKARARWQGLNLSGIAAGPLIATPLTVWITSQWGWQMAFYVFASISVVWMSFWIWIAKTDYPEKHPWVKPDELAMINEDRHRDIEISEKVSPLKSPAVWVYSFAYFCFTYTWWLFLNWLPTYMVQERGFSLGEMGILASLPWLAAFLTMLLSGAISDWLVAKGMKTGNARRLMIYVGSPLMGASVWGASQASDPMTATWMLVVTMAFAGLNFPSFWTLPVDMNPKTAGLVSGMMNTGSATAAILAPLCTGFVVQYLGWYAAITIGAVLALLVGILIFLIRPKNVAGQPEAA